MKQHTFFVVYGFQYETLQVKECQTEEDVLEFRASLFPREDELTDFRVIEGRERKMAAVERVKVWKLESP